MHSSGKATLDPKVAEQSDVDELGWLALETPDGLGVEVSDAR